MARDDIKDKKVRCSFCNRTADQVERMISGPNVYICDICIEQCMQIIESVPSTQRKAAVTTDKIDKYKSGYRIERFLKIPILISSSFFTLRFNPLPQIKA